MNNKIMARIVAVVMAVAMLGTVSFAATVTVPTEVAGNGVKTVMAVASSTATMPETITDDMIIDVQQLSAEDEYPTTINYDATRFAATGARYIIVRFGGDTTAAYDAVIDTQLSTKPGAVLETLEVKYEWTVGEKTYTNVVAAKFEIPLDETYKLGSYGIRFGKWSVDPTNATDGTLDDGVLEAKFEGDLTKAEIFGGGTLTYTAIVVGATGADNVEGFGYATYADAN